MSVAAAVVAVVWFLVAFVGRTVMQKRRTGDSGLRVRTSPPAERVLFTAAALVLLIALSLAAFDVIAPIDGLVSPIIQWVGLVLAVLGALATFAAQVDLGASWRIGVDPDERTDLVTGGLFAVVRNPIFSAMILTVVGLAVASPTWLAVLGAVATVVSIEFQVRGVEEPYLLRTHGDAYRSYAARVGRFVPRLGRLA